MWGLGGGGQAFMGPLKHVQLMSIAKIGHHGEPFDEKVLNKISDLRQMYPSVTISVDGGINLETGKKCVEAGADILAVGSALWNSDNLEETIKQFQSL